MTTKKATTTPARVERSGHLRWITISELTISPKAQRDLRPGWAARIAADFDPDRFTAPLVSLRDGKFYVIDGQHRVEAMRLMDWNDQQVQCHVFEGLDEAAEADLFLWHNNRKAVGAFEKFMIALVADRDDECDIQRIVLANGLKLSKSEAEGSIQAVGALRKVYAHSPKTLARTLRIVRDAYGDDGLDGVLIEGIGLLCARYNGELNDESAISRMQTARGGIGALNTKAFTLRKQTARPLPHCYAAAAVEIINAGRGGKKLASWWT